jgi:hypothetical protein
LRKDFINGISEALGITRKEMIEIRRYLSSLLRQGLLEGVYDARIHGGICYKIMKINLKKRI